MDDYMHKLGVCRHLGWRVSHYSREGAGRMEDSRIGHLRQHSNRSRNVPRRPEEYLGLLDHLHSQAPERPGIA